jgi:acyl-CoA thioesterase II
VSNDPADPAAMEQITDPNAGPSLPVGAGVPRLQRGVALMDGIEGAKNPADAVVKVLQVLDVQPDPDAGEDVFAGFSYRPPWGRIFGGQVLAQSLMAAHKTVGDERKVHSLHAYFLRAGDPEVPIQFAVERLRDGRSFSARRTQAIQNGKAILSMISSFQTPSEGLDHQAEMPKVPAPEDLPSMEDLFGHYDVPAIQQMLRSRPVDMRHVEGPLYISAASEKVAHQAVWLRAAAPMPDDALLHTTMLAFSSDYSLLESVLRRHGLSWSTHGMRTASLDHAMWFHRPARVDDWLLYVQRSPSASGARGMGLGQIFTRDGILIASTAQEGMMRVPADQLHN